MSEDTTKAICEYMNIVLITTKFHPDERKYLDCWIEYTEIQDEYGVWVEEETIVIEDIGSRFGHLYTTVRKGDFDPIYNPKFSFNELKEFLNVEDDDELPA